MSYSIDEINFIVYNNRSFNGTTRNFFPNIENIELFLELEKKYIWLNQKYKVDRSIVIPKEEIDLSKDDIFLDSSKVDICHEHIIKSVNNFSKSEYEFLVNRGISDDIIIKYNLGSLSSIKDTNILEYIGATTHPILRGIFGDGVCDGIIIPQFINGRFSKCDIRKLNEITKFKYNDSIPGVYVYGIDSIAQGDEVWITEGTFDTIAMLENGYKSLSCSTSKLSILQLYTIMRKLPSKINIFTDKDAVGYNNSFVMCKFFNMCGIKSSIYQSKYCKDASEHFFEKEYSVDDIEEKKITVDDFINVNDSVEFNFFEYLKNRKFN